MSGPSVEAPKPSDEERALQREQAELLRQQRDILSDQADMQELLLPAFAAQSGLNLIYGDDGEITGVEHIIDPALQQQATEAQFEQLLAEQEFYKENSGLRELQFDVEKQLAERSLKALRGELDVDPALERELGQQEETLRERLRQQFGAGFETGTPGIQALQEFQDSATGLRSAARRGELTLSEQLGQARTALRQGQGQQTINNLGQLLGLQGINTGNQQQAIFGPALSIAGGIGQNAAGFGSAQIPYQQQRQMEFDASMFNAQNSGGFLGPLGSIFGSVLSAVPFSDYRLKSWWLPIGKLYNGVKLYLFEYSWGEQRIGVMAHEVPWAAVEKDGYLAVDYARV